ncbi:M48 family metalloprotease [Litorisediminicola beolgyonensis]|uniref:M48 family metalloprotease n=1 Tax=Litorisediminicola beolgyonensis TaxID=1173614 RepID=A0ABW3ZG87_9RHOB
MKSLRFLVLLAALVVAGALPARAVTLLRDADIEYALGELAEPVLRAAGLSPGSVKVLLVDDGALNAFVADSRHILIHSGLVLKLETARSLQAVIAHEAAHIANGHFTRRAANMRNARTAAGLGAVLAAVAAASGQTEAAVGIGAGAGSAAARNFLAHTRAEESAADQSGIRYMQRAGIDPEGAAEVLRIFRGQEALSAARQDPYLLTHPLTRDRLRAVEGFAAAARGSYPPDGTAAYWFARAKGKLSAFQRAPKWTLRRVSEGPTRDIALMREAVARHRQSDLRGALKAIDGALALRPSDPFLMDLKGQILLENRQAGAAAQVYSAASSRAPGNALIRGGLGRALLAAGDFKGALVALEGARDRDAQDGRVLRDLAVAYAKTGQMGLASVVTAERYALQGRMRDAGVHATRALGLLPRGSPAWNRADDVLRAAERTRR